MQIIDAQVHIWGADTPQRPWPKRQAAHRPVPLGKDELLREMDAAGVHAAILVPPSWEGERNDLALEAVRQHPDRFAVMGRLNTEAPGAAAQLETWKSQPGMLGLRMALLYAPWQLPLLTEGKLDWFWPVAERLDIPLMVLTAHSLIHYFEKIIARHPGLRIVMDHCALTPHTIDEEAFRDLDKLLALARLPNVMVKVSALQCHTSEAYPYPPLQQHIRRVYDAFGPKRMFWGSDLSRLPCTYRQCVTTFTEEIPWLSNTDKELIMGRALSNWLRWKPAEIVTK